MRYSLFLTGFVASLAAAAPGKKRQAAAAPVFTAQTFADLSIAGGTAGDAAAEAQAKLAGLPADLTTVAPEDVEFLSAVNSIANDAGKQISRYNITCTPLQVSWWLYLGTSCRRILLVSIDAAGQTSLGTYSSSISFSSNQNVRT